MRLNLKKATISKIGDGKYRLIYDISKMNKPRLTQEARMYIEYLNLPEFIDDTWGNGNGDNRGRLEIFCDNLEDDNYDEDGYGTQTLLYSSPLQSFKSFTNADPLKISNFKVRSNFLRDQIVMTLCIYDQYGDPYEKPLNRVQLEMDKTSVSYGNYLVKTNEMSVLEDRKRQRQEELEILTDKTADLQRTAEYLRLQMEAKYTDFINALGSSSDVFLNEKIQLYKSLLSNITIPDYVNYVLNLSTNTQLLFNNPNILSAKDAFATAYYLYEKAQFEVQDNLTRISEYNQAGTTIIDNEIYTFIPDRFPTTHINKTIKSAKNKLVNFSVKDTTGATIADGTIMIDYFFNKEQDSVSAYNLTINSGLAEVKTGAVLEIPSTTFEAFVPETFEWVAGKTTGTLRTAQQTFVPNFTISSINITDGGTLYTSTPSVTIDPPPAGGTPATAVAVRTLGVVTQINITNAGFGYTSIPTITIDAPANASGRRATALGVLSTNLYNTPADKRFMFSIKKIVGNTNYQVDLRNDLFSSQHFNINDQVIFTGTQFGGNTPANDLTITITDIEIAQDETFTFNLEIPDDKGNFDLEITKDKTNGKYINFSILTNNTKNLKVGDTIKIPFSQLNGVDDTHNFEIEVEHVLEAEREVVFDATTIIHQIEVVTIDDTANPLIIISDATGSVKSDRSDYSISISSQDGKYTFDVEDGGNNFEVGDEIHILGAFFKGTNGDPDPSLPNDPTSGGHDLKLVVNTIDASGTITELAEIDEFGASATAIWDATTGAVVGEYWNARCPTSISVKVKTINNSNVYVVNSTELIYEPLDQVKNGDIFRVPGDEFFDYSTLDIPINGGDADINQLFIEIKNVDPSTGTPPPEVRPSANSEMEIEITGTAIVEPSPVGKLRNLGFKVLADQGKHIPDVGKIKTFTAAGTHVVTAESQPTLEIELTQDLIEGLPNIDTAINSKKTEVDTAKITLVPSKQIFQVEIDQTKLKNLNMGLVLYDEVPEYTQASKDAIVGNTYSRIMNNQFKRI